MERKPDLDKSKYLPGASYFQLHRKKINCIATNIQILLSCDNKEVVSELTYLCPPLFSIMLLDKISTAKKKKSSAYATMLLRVVSFLKSGR